MRRWLVVVPMVLGFTTLGCSGAESNSAQAGGGDASAAPSTAAGPARKTVLFLGTSLTAALGLDPEQGYPAVVQEKIDSAGLPFTAVNAGASGETAAGALRRLEWLLQRRPFDVIVVETGANDMLRGADLAATRANIQAIFDRVRQANPNARIVLAGMMAPPNLGQRYAEGYRDIYVDLARENGIPLIPFLLEGVGGQPEMNQGDGIHPNVQGQRRVAANVWAVLEPVLRAEAAEPAPPPQPAP